MIAGVFRLGTESRKRLLEAARQWPAPLQSQTWSHYVSQSQSIDLLLDEIENNRLAVSSISPSQQEMMRQNSHGVLRDRVIKWIGNDDSSNRKAIIDRFEQEWPEKVDFEPGKQLFETHCAKCHRSAEGIASATPIGPTLQGLSHWTNRAWLEAIIDPSRAVDEKYKRSIIRTNGDSVLAGLVRQETESEIEIVLTDGRVETILKAEIEEIKSSEQSLMPDGFEKNLTPEQIAQLVTYLRRGGN